MRRLAVALALLASTYVTVAQAQTISARTIETVARSLDRDYRSGGMSLLAANASDCYAAARTQDAAGKCVLYDIAAHRLDASYRQDQLADPGPWPYFSDEQLAGRVVVFINSYLGGSKGLFSSYMGRAPQKVELRLVQLSKAPYKR